MKHHIIVKFREGTDYRSMKDDIQDVFDETLSIDGIHSVDIRLSNSERANRYDMMIVMDMDKEALPQYDVSEPHLRWKSEYGELIEKKAIFDCE